MMRCSCGDFLDYITQNGVAYFGCFRENRWTPVIRRILSADEQLKSPKKKGRGQGRKSPFAHFTDEELLESLRKFAKRLGRTPTQDEWSNGGIASVHIFKRRFGSLRKVIELAGLEYRENRNGGITQRRLSPIECGREA